MSDGVPVFTSRPNQTRVVSSGKASSAKVGTSFMAGQRSALVMPNALSWPAAYCAAEEVTCAKPNSECPAIRPVTCSPDPRYGTWVRSRSNFSLSRKPSRCDGVPAVYEEYVSLPRLAFAQVTNSAKLAAGTLGCATSTSGACTPLIQRQEVVDRPAQVAVD